MVEVEVVTMEGVKEEAMEDDDITESLEGDPSKDKALSSVTETPSTG